MVDTRAESSYTQRVLSHLRSWPNVSADVAECGSGLALRSGEVEIAHLHAEDDAEIRLGSPIVLRMRTVLQQTGRVRLGEESVRLRLESENDVRLLLSLLSVAIKAATDERAYDRNGPWCRISCVARSA